MTFKFLGHLGLWKEVLAHFPVALDCQMAKYVRSIFRDVRLARRQHQITDGGLKASPAQKRAKNVDGKKGACKNN